MSNPGKQPRITIKKDVLGIKVGMADYRFLIALILVLGLVIVLIRGDAESGKVLVPLVLLAVEWHFKDKLKR
jgi:hypothetical protein